MTPKHITKVERYKSGAHELQYKLNEHKRQKIFVAFYHCGYALF